MERFTGPPPALGASRGATSPDVPCRSRRYALRCAQASSASKGGRAVQPPLAQPLGKISRGKLVQAHALRRGACRQAPVEALGDALYELAAVRLRRGQIALVLSFRHCPRLEGVMGFRNSLLDGLPVGHAAGEVRHGHQEPTTLVAGERFDADGIVFQSHCAASISRTSRRMQTGPVYYRFPCFFRCNSAAGVVSCQHATSETPQEGCGSRTCAGRGRRMACHAHRFWPPMGRHALWRPGRSGGLPSLDLVDASQPGQPRQAAAAAG